MSIPSENSLDQATASQIEQINALNQFLQDTMNSPELPSFDLSHFDHNFQNLASSVLLIASSASEAHAVARSISEGHLETQVKNSNPLIHPLKNLQATLRHLTWQTKQIAGGDYDQHVNFLGDFSTAFNIMVEQLKLREQLIRENAEKEKQTIESINELLKSELNNQVEHYKSLTETNHQLHAFRHDMKNHFFCIDSFLQDGKTDEAIRYIASITKVINKESNAINTDNYVFDALVGEKIRLAKENGIKVNTKLSLRPGLNIAPVDWCILFGNALDNALEACAYVEESPFINITVSQKGSFLSVKIENSFKIKPIIENGEIITLKDDTLYHGKGLSNIKETVKNYDGTLELDFNENVFTLSFLLCNIESR